MKNRSLACVSAVLVLLSFSAHAGKTFKFPSGMTVGYIDDATCWSGDSGADRHCSQAGTIYATNGVSWSAWQFEYGYGNAETPTVVHVLSGGSVGDDMRPGNGAGKYGLLLVDEGATLNGGAVIGVGGYGVVTNNGTWKKSAPMQLGVNAGSHGVFVQNGTISHTYPKEMHIGEKGWGEFILNAPFSWTFNKHGDGDIVIGQSQEDNNITINENGKLTAYYVYIGGRIAGQAGRGTLRLRGGVYNNNRDNGDKEDLFYLGACLDENGEIDPLSYGRITGWGRFEGNDVSRRSNRGVYIRVGRGEIVGDGEGDESHGLLAYQGLYQVTNVLFGVKTTSGWRAINKGWVDLSRGGGYGWEVGSTNHCVGCGTMLEKPDLVNAVKIYCKDMVRNLNKSFAAAVLAPDRSDAYTNALPTGVVSVLSIHRLGVFSAYDTTNKANGVYVSTFKADFRYDQTKLSTRDDTRLEILRYTEASGRWNSVGKLDYGERPDDCIISIPDYISGSTGIDENYNLGTFAIVERERRGAVLIFR